ncbi:serine/threonine-protein kinase HT1-like isoform X1 [Cucurbita moschata]|uniref:Serine/threonine-protein kinase HT1-like isoform X1 n=1 Tax=Cucurbita moschata TaxID=3662 RepID=A0A6J1E6K8_CUCMO|nr:serine/threonine-protein kinase HT1-like isoform X1 [Cucurbita moschata]
MESGDGLCSKEFDLDAKWLVDPKQILVGPRIGEGAHGKVHKGKYKNENVAIKIIRRGETPEEIAKTEARFAREVAMLSKVQHKNLAKFIGACKEPIMVIVTELLLGGTLRRYLLSIRPRCLDLHEAACFALDIARAMECLHSHGIIHRDLKPENLILTGDHKTVKLTDFGLAREESVTEMMTAETGTYRWMAPELYSTVTLRNGEKKHYNHKVDVYSFGIVFWEIVQNKLPFEGMSNLQAAYAAAFKNFRPNAENLPEYLAPIITSCWTEDPNTRPNFSEIIQMLLKYLSTIPQPEYVTPPTVQAPENAVLPPESPGTSSLMAATRRGTGDVPKSEIEEKPSRFFSCFSGSCY